MQVRQDGIGRAELPIQVRQLASRVPKEQPSRNAVVPRAEIEKQRENAAGNPDRVVPKQARLVRREERQLARKPRHDQERGQTREERRVRDHRAPSSNA